MTDWPGQPVSPPAAAQEPPPEPQAGEQWPGQRNQASGKQPLKITVRPKPETKESGYEDVPGVGVVPTTTSGFENFGTGFMDPIEGGGQLIADILPARANRILTSLNNTVAPYSGGLIRELPEGGKDEQIRQREAEAAKRAPEGMDWGRIAGNALNPVNYIGGGAREATGLIGTGLRMISAGATAGALQPTTAKDPLLGKATQAVVGGAIGGGLGALTAGASTALKTVGNYVASKFPDALESQAVQKILRRMQQDEKAGGLTATDMITLVDEAKKPVNLADVAGPNTRNLAGNVARQPGEGMAKVRNALEQRDNAAAQRLSQDIEETVHGGQTMHQASEALLRARSAAARPAYDEMHKLQGIWSSRLAEFFDDPVIKSGLTRGYELERLESLAEGRPISLHQMGVDLDVEGNIKLVNAPNMRLLDMAKRGVDAMIADERNAITGRLSARGVALEKLRQSYVKTIDDLDTSGAYKRAREAWAGYSGSLDALKLGRSVFANSPEEVEAALKDLSPGNKEFYRLGVADVLKERLAKTGLSGDEAKALLKNSWTRDQLRPVFRSKEDFDKFVDAVTTETKMFSTGQKLLGGSQTAERVAEDTAESPLMQSGSILHKLAAGRLFSAAKEAFQFYQDIGMKPNPEMNAKIAEILFTSNLPKESSAAQKLMGGIKPSPLAGVAQGVLNAGRVAAPNVAGDVTRDSQ